MKIKSIYKLLLPLVLFSACTIVASPDTSPSDDKDTMVKSTFDSDDEGWRVEGDAQNESTTPDYLKEGGNPDGHVSATDDSVGGVWYWSAPEKFLGDQSKAYGKKLKFDLKQPSLVIQQFDGIDIAIESEDMKIVYDTKNNPDKVWSSYSVTISASENWKIDKLDGKDASESDIKKVLSSVKKLLIRGEFITGDDHGELDNVILELNK